MKKLLLVSLVALSFTGCNKRDNSLPPGQRLAGWALVHDQQFQAVCCRPDQMHPQNAAVCKELLASGDSQSGYSKNIGGTIFWAVNGDCTNLDETPYWGR